MAEAEVRHVVTASFRAGKTSSVARSLWQWDYGIVLRFDGISLPDAYEVHFSNSATGGDAVSQTGTSDGVVVPNIMFESGKPVYAFVYLHDDLDDGETAYTAVIPVHERPKPNYDEVTPKQQSAFEIMYAQMEKAIRAESVRVSAEEDRSQREEERIAAEEARGSAEAIRVQNEAERISGEAERVSAELEREGNEDARLSGETMRIAYEGDRLAAEERRVEAEIERRDGEAARVSDETERRTAEAQRISAEERRVSDENARQTNETARQAAEEGREALADELRGITANAVTLEPGSAATADYNAGVITFGIPHGEKGDTGEQGPRGERGLQGVKGDTGPRGVRGDQGARGEKGDTGPAGPEGFSPIAYVTKEGNTSTIVVSDLYGITMTDVVDGVDGPPGPEGAAGPAGPKGDPGEGVPTGGTAGQVLTKGSATDYDTVWRDPAGGGGADWDAEAGEDGYVANRPVHASSTEQEYVNDSFACTQQGIDGIWYYRPSFPVGQIPASIARNQDTTWLVTLDGVEYTAKSTTDQYGNVCIGGTNPGDPDVITIGYGIQFSQYSADYVGLYLLAIPSDAAKTVSLSLSAVVSQITVDPRYDFCADWSETDSGSIHYIRNKPAVVQDVQSNGTSVVQNGIAYIPIASASAYGTVKISSGLQAPFGNLQIKKSSSAEVKAGTDSYAPIVPNNEHEAAFYGLAKAAGDSTQSASSNAVGSYTEDAKSVISEMLSGAVTVSGTTPNITAKAGVRYICGTISTLMFTPSATGICDVRFTSGSTATVLTVPSTVLWPGWFDPTSLDANTTYEINVMDGIYGAVAIWS